MNIKYSTSEMEFEGIFPVDYPHMRVFETQLLFLNAKHIPLLKILNSNQKYKGDLLFNIGKGDFSNFDRKLAWHAGFFLFISSIVTPYINSIFNSYGNWTKS